MTTVGELADPELIFPAIEGPDARSAVRHLAEKIVATGRVSESERLFAKLWEREALCSTAVGSGVAIPHCKIDEMDEVLLAVGVSPGGVEFGAPDGDPVVVFFVLVTPSSTPATHLRSLAAVSKWVKESDRVDRLVELEDAESMFAWLTAVGESPDG